MPFIIKIPLSDVAPVTQAEGDAPSPGTGAQASRYDHRHGMPADYTPKAHAHDAAEITTGRFGMPRMPDGTSGYVLTAKGAGVDPAYEPGVVREDITALIGLVVG